MAQSFLDVRPLGLACPDVLEVVPVKHEDNRGFFSEVYNKGNFRSSGIDAEFMQDNQSLSHQSGTVRGLHFQRPPAAQTKLIRVLRGAIFDVAVDIRFGSPTFGQHVSAVVSAEAWNQILVPAGFAHGFATLDEDTEVLYKVDAPYAKEHDMGVLWSDPVLDIAWPVSPDQALVSEKDKIHPVLADLAEDFHYSDCRS